MKMHQMEFLAHHGDRRTMDKIAKSSFAQWFTPMFVHNPNVDEDQLEAALNSKHWEDRAELAASNFATDEHLKDLLIDPDDQVRRQARSTIQKRLREMRNKDLEADRKD